MNKFRNGLYVKYQGKEYFALPLDSKRIKLLSYEKPAPQGFKDSIKEAGMSFCILQKSEIKESFRIKTVIRYKGKDFFLSEEKEGYVLIETNDEVTANSYKMDHIAANLYIKWIKIGDIEGTYEFKK